MNTVADIVLILAVIGLILGLMKPTLVSNRFKAITLTRKTIALGFGVIIVIALVVLYANAPKQKNVQNTANKTQTHVSNTPAQTTTTTQAATTPAPTSNAASAKATVLAQMNTIQTDLNNAWQSCQNNPSCQGQIAAIPDYQKLYDDNSASFSGKASDDFSGWRTDIGMAEGDMKQWAVNESFNRPSSTLTVASVSQEVANVQGDVSGFSSD